MDRMREKGALGASVQFLAQFRLRGGKVASREQTFAQPRRRPKPLNNLFSVGQNGHEIAAATLYSRLK